MHNMERKEISPPTSHGASGPLVALCAGHRCNALHHLATGQSGTDRLRPTIASERGAVLVSTDCLGACASGAVAAVARRDGATGKTGPSVWLGGMDQPAALDAFLSWLSAGGPLRTDEPIGVVPPELHSAVLGVGHPLRTHQTKL